jgi:hypothetical protein
MYIRTAAINGKMIRNGITAIFYISSSFHDEFIITIPESNEQGVFIMSKVR